MLGCNILYSLKKLTHLMTVLCFKLRGFSPQANYTDSDRRMSAKLMPTFADRGCGVVSATDPHGR
jgi:hypothetical protein